MPRSIPHVEVAYLVDPARVETMNVLGPTIQFLTPSDESNAPCIMRGTIPAGVSIPLHSHGDPETFVTISGSVEGLVYSEEEQKWVRIGSGDIFHVPGHAKHAWRNDGDVPAVMLVISTSKIGRFFRELATAAVPDAPNTDLSPEQILRFHEISRRYGYWNASPEENARVGINV